VKLDSVHPQITQITQMNQKPEIKPETRNTNQKLETQTRNRNYKPETRNQIYEQTSARSWLS